MRRSKDLEKNGRGTKFLDLCDSNGLIILNGRFPGDLAGEYTFISHVGSSVNDICAASLDCIPFILDFKVLSESFSDHFPINVIISIGEPTSNETCLPLLPRIQWVPKLVDDYKHSLISALNTTVPSPNDPQSQLELIVGAIKASVPPCPSNSTFIKLVKIKPWFDYSCLKARARCFNLLSLYRNSNSPLVKRAYLDSNKKYKTLCETKKKDYYISVSNQFKTVNNSKDLWCLINSFKNKGFLCSNSITLSSWASYFQSLLNAPSYSPMILYAEPQIVSPLLDSPFSLEELKSAVNNLKTHKAPGYDRITSEFYKFAPEILYDRLLSLFNYIYQTGSTPSSFSTSIIFPIFKHGSISEVSNYRGISCLDTVSKIFTGLLLQRLEHFVSENKLLSEYQAGFRRGYSTYDNLFTLTNIVNLKFLRKKQKVYAFFVDLKAAFDSVNHRLLLLKLSNLGISSQFINCIRSLYLNSSSAVRGISGVSEFFGITKGVRQGCLLSPLLFSLFLDDLPNALECGVHICRAIIKVLMYADDVVILADNPVALQLNINALAAYLELWGLQLNLQKSKIMVFRRGGPLASREKWTYKGQPIEVVPRYKYLGVTLTSRISFNPHLLERISVAKLALNRVWSHFLSQSLVPLPCKYLLFNAVSRSLVCYAAQVWGSESYDSLERFQHYFIKKLFSLPSVAPNYMLHLETGVDLMKIFTLRVHFKYCLRVLNYPSDRLPRLLALQIINRRTSWFANWISLARKYESPFDYSTTNVDLWKEQLSKLLSKIGAANRDEFLKSALSSTHYTLYPLLDHAFNMCSLLEDNAGGLTLAQLGWVFKLRGELLQVSHRPWVVSEAEYCPSCNMRVVEDQFHFLAECPRFSESRLLFTGFSTLTSPRIIALLNDPTECLKLIKFAGRAWSIRSQLL